MRILFEGTHVDQVYLYFIFFVSMSDDEQDFMNSTRKRLKVTEMDCKSKNL